MLTTTARQAQRHRTWVLVFLLATAILLLILPRAAGADVQLSDRAIDVLPPPRDIGHWTIGFGPFLGHHLGSGKAMYNFAVGYVWDINPHASVKTFGESNFSSGSENTRFLNVAIGADFFSPYGERKAYLTSDIGYGFARNARTETAEGFSLGLGVGLQFFRTAETTLDLMLRYAVIFDGFADGTANPSVTGLRLAVDF